MEAQAAEGDDDDADADDGYLLDPSLLSEATLPISNISRLMKKALPKQAKISSSSKELIQSCCIEFISFLTSEANEKCLLEKRKTINGDDILYAMKVLGFEEFEIVCRIWLGRYRMVSPSPLEEAKWSLIHFAGTRHRWSKAVDVESRQILRQTHSVCR